MDAKSRFSNKQLKQNLEQIQVMLKRRESINKCINVDSKARSPFQEISVNKSNNYDVNKRANDMKANNVQLGSFLGFKGRVEKKFEIVHTGKISSSSINMVQIENMWNQQKYGQVIEILQKQQKKINNKICLSYSDKENISIDKNTHKTSSQMYQNILLYLGNCFYKLKNTDKALEYLSRFGFQYTNKQINIKRKNNIAICNSIKNQKQKALQILMDLLKIKYIGAFEQAVILYNIGLVNMKLSMFRTSQEYFMKSINKHNSESYIHQEFLGDCHFYLGLCFRKMTKFQESLKHLMISYNYGNSNSIKQICQVLQQEGRLKEALDYYQKLIENHIGQKYWERHVYKRVSSIYKKMNNFRLFMKYQTKSQQICIQQGEILDKTDIQIGEKFYILS